jgi:hypothetical protein
MGLTAGHSAKLSEAVGNAQKLTKTFPAKVRHTITFGKCRKTLVATLICVLSKLERGPLLQRNSSIEPSADKVRL